MRGSNTDKSVLDAVARQWLENQTPMGNVSRAYRQRKAGQQDGSSPPAPDKTRATAAVYNESRSGVFSDDSDDEEPAPSLDDILATLLNRKQSPAFGGDDIESALDMFSKLGEVLEAVRGAQAGGGRSGAGGDEVDKAGEESISRARKEAERKEAERKAEEEARRRAASAKRRIKLEEKRRKAAEEQAEQVMRRSEEMEARRRREEEAEMRRRQEEERVRVTLFKAAAEGREKEVVALLEGMPDSSYSLKLRGDTGESLLHACVSRNPPDEATAGRLNTAAVLFELDEKKGCVVDMVTCRDARGHALIHSIAEASNEAYLQLLLARKACMPQWKLDLNAVCQEGLTPLHHASRAAAPGIVKLLLDNDAVISKASGSTPLDLIRGEVEQAGDEGEEAMLSERQRRLRQVHQLLSEAVAQKEAAAAQRKREALERKERKLQEKKEEAALEDNKKNSGSVLRSAAEELERKIKKEMEAKAKLKQQKKDAKRKEEEKHEALRLLAAERSKERNKEKERDKKAVVVPQLIVRAARTRAPPTAEVREPAIASALHTPPPVTTPAVPAEIINPGPIVINEPLVESLKDDMMMQLVATAAGGASAEVGSQEASDAESEAEMQAAVSVVDTAQLELQLSLTEKAKVEEEMVSFVCLVQPVKRRQPALMLSRKEEGRRVHRESVQMAEEDEGMWVRMQEEAEARLFSARVELEAAEANLKLVLQRREAQQAVVALAKAPSSRAAAVSQVLLSPSSEALQTLDTSEAPFTSPSHIGNDVSVESAAASPLMTQSETEPAPTPAINPTVQVEPEPVQVEPEPVQVPVVQPGNETSVVKATEEKVDATVATDAEEMEAQAEAAHESSPPVRKAKRSRGVKRGDGRPTHDGERSTRLGSDSINVDGRVGRDGRSGKRGNVVEWGKVDVVAPVVSVPGTAVGADVQGQEVQGETAEGRNAGRQGKRRMSGREREQERRRIAAEISAVNTNATAAAAHVIELPPTAPNNASETEPAVQEETTLSSIVGLMVGPLSRPPAAPRGGEGGDVSMIDEVRRRRSRRRGGKGRGGRGRDSGERDTAQHDGVQTSVGAVETKDVQQLVHDPPPSRHQQRKQQAGGNVATSRDAAADEKSNRRTDAGINQAKDSNKAASEERGERQGSHNDKKAAAANGYVGGGGKGIQNKQKTVNVSSKSNIDASSHVARFHRVCKFFGLGNGCDRGLDCPFRHDHGPARFIES